MADYDIIPDKGGLSIKNQIKVVPWCNKLIKMENCEQIHAYWPIHLFDLHDNEHKSFMLEGLS